MTVMYLLNKNYITQDLNIDEETLFKFIQNIQNAYKDNPYHTKLHGFDVLQTVNFFVKKC